MSALAADSENRFMKRVLMLSYGFPPRGGGGVQRTAKFAKYLPQFGWVPTVITPQWDDHTRRELDLGLEAEVRETAVVYSGPPCAVGKVGVWRMLSKLPIVWRAAGTLQSNLQYPDFARRWIAQAVETGQATLANERFDAIYSTSPPVAAHVAAMRLKQRTGLPWIADFRDPWTDNKLKNERAWAARIWLDRQLERRVYETADVIVANTSANQATLANRFPHIASKLVTITNGYDEDDFQEVRKEIRKSALPNGHFRITYSGSAYGGYNPDVFCPVFSKFLEKRPEAAIRWTLAGTACKWAEGITDSRIASHVDLLGYLPHEEVPPLLASSHILLQIMPSGMPYWIPGKLYEYLRSGTPIVAVCDRDSEVEKILAATGRGIAFTHDNVDSFVDYLNAAYCQWERGEWKASLAPDQTIERYERRELTRRLADQLSAISERSDLDHAPAATGSQFDFANAATGDTRVDDRD